MSHIYAKGRTYEVEADYIDNKVVIRKGGRISGNEGKSLSGKLIKLRNDEKLVKGGIVQRTIEFSSLSTAACFVTGTMTNGYKVWKDYKTKNLIGENRDENPI